MNKARDLNDYDKLGIEPVVTVERMEERHSVDSVDCAAGWGALEAFGEGGELPSFPVEALPEPWSDYVSALSVATQVPVDLPAMLLLGVWATALQGKYRIRGWEGWYEPLCLWPVVVLDPGNRKSAVQRELFEPVHRYERTQRDVEEPRRQESLARQSALDSELARVRKRTLRADAAEEDEAALSALLEQRRALGEVPELPVLVTADATMEAIGVLLQTQGRITLASPEGAEVFGIAAGRYSDGHNFDLLLKAHAADSHTVHRIGRDPLYIDRAIASVALSVQPEVLEQLARDSTGMHGRGFLARFLWSLPRSPLGSRQVRAPAVSESLSTFYTSAVTGLLSLPGQRRDGAWEARLVELSQRAQAALESWAGEIEPMLGEGGLLSSCSGWGSKLAGATLRIAGLLHGAERPYVDPSSRPVSAEMLSRAVCIARYCIPHALAAFGRMGKRSESEQMALRVLRWIRERGHTSFSERDCYRDLDKSFARDVSKVRPVLEELEARNYLRLTAEPARPAGRAGRKPSPVWEVNPAALPPNRQNRRNDGS